MSDSKKPMPSRRPAEAATGVAGAGVAILVATTGLSTELATALVLIVGALPGIVTAVVSTTRATAAGTLLVGLTPEVASLAGSALKAARAESASLADKTATLKGVAESMASWTDVLSAEPSAGASASDEPRHGAQ